MKQIILLILFTDLLLGIVKVNAQATTANATNTPTLATDYLGWSTGKDIDFKTGGTQYMKLDGTVNAGFISLSNSWPFTPQNQIHQHWSGSSNVFHQFTNGTTGNTSSNGFLVGIATTGIAEFRQQQALPIIFWSLSTPSGSGTMRERVRISDGLGGDNTGGWNTINGVTKVSISHDGTGANSLPQSVAMLNIGASDPIGFGAQAGNRDWMDVGTYYDYGSDNMYVGLKDMGVGLKDAIINWGEFFLN